MTDDELAALETLIADAGKPEPPRCAHTIYGRLRRAKGDT